MKKSLLIVLLVMTNLAGAQIKIGDNPQTLDATSLLELESNSKVLIISRMTEVEMLALTPLQGAMVYNTDASCIFYYDGTDWNNLCAGGSTGSIAWGSITGTLSDQTDLAAEFQNYVDLTTAQSIAGEKLLTEKLTVDTGDLTVQSAEFLGRVKGENGIAPEDFVTRQQLDAVTAGGHTGNPGSIFFAGDNLQPTEDNASLYWDTTNKQLRIGSFIDLIDKFAVFYDNSTTLNIQGSVSKPYDQATTLTEEHHTIAISWTTTLTLPDPATCFGRIYIIKVIPTFVPGIVVSLNSSNYGYKGYNDTMSIQQDEFPIGVTQLQSNGLYWEQIN